jgi:hypothetical protein
MKLINYSSMQQHIPDFEVPIANCQYQVSSGGTPLSLVLVLYNILYGSYSMVVTHSHVI